MWRAVGQGERAASGKRKLSAKSEGLHKAGDKLL